MAWFESIDWLRIVMICLALFMVFDLSRLVYINRSRGSYALKVWSQWSIGLLVEALLVLAAVGAVGYPLVKYVPYLNIGWYDLAFGHPGTIAITAPEDASGSKWAFIAFLLLFLAAMPYATEIEEKSFRSRKIKPSQWIPSSVGFGLIHLVMGIPVGIGIALIAAGVALSIKYNVTRARYLRYHPSDLRAADQAGILASGSLHCLYNSVIVVVAIVMLLVS